MWQIDTSCKIVFREDQGTMQQTCGQICGNCNKGQNEWSPGFIQVTLEESVCLLKREVLLYNPLFEGCQQIFGQRRPS